MEKDKDEYRWVVYRNRDGWCSMCSELAWIEYLGKTSNRKMTTHLTEICRVDNHKRAEQLCQLANAEYGGG